MKILEQFTQPRNYVPLLVVVSVVLALVYRRHASQSPAAEAAREGVSSKPHWLYVSKLPQDDPFYELSGRPLFLKPGASNSYVVEYRVFSPVRMEDDIRVAGVKQVPADQTGKEGYELDWKPKSRTEKLPDEVVMEPRFRHRLQPCPMQAGYGRFMGTTSIWRTGGAVLRADETVHNAQLGDTVTVEIKNLDGWLFEQFDYGRLREDLDPPPDALKTLLGDIVKERRCLSLLIAIYRGNKMLQQEIKTPEAWSRLVKNIEGDRILNGIKNADEHAKMITSGTELTAGSALTAENVAKLQRVFLPLKLWEEHLTANRFRQLTLTLNGVTLAGVTPNNPNDMAEIEHEDRPSVWDDLYQRATFRLVRKKAVAGDSEEERAMTLKNQAAWQELVGTPRLHLPCKVTLRLQKPELELPTLILPGAKGSEYQFDLVGISRIRLSTAILVFIVILALLSWLAMTTNILRDTTGRIRADGIEPVSLGKTQMAFWFILIATAYVFLWITKDEADSIINETCLILLGIGSGTALGAAVISVGTSGRRYLVTSTLSQERDRTAREIMEAILVRLRKLARLLDDQDLALRRELAAILRQLKREMPEDRSDKSGLHERLSGLLDELEKNGPPGEAALEIETQRDVDGALVALAQSIQRRASTGGTDSKNLDSGALAAELELLGTQRAEFKRMADNALKRVFCDWLCEGDSGKYSFHRFQMLAWTLLLGFVFVAKVLSDRSMPEFSALTLALLGISAGTYLGFKLPATGTVDGSKS